MTVPTALLEMQQWMGGLLKRPMRETGRFRFPIYDAQTTREVEQRISAGPFLSAAERFGLMHQQFWFRMFVFMQERYPTLLRLFGYADFNFSIVEPYILKYFPNHWSLLLFGRHLPQWLDEEYHEEDRPLVLAVAQVDAAYERLYSLGLSSELPFEYDYISFRKRLLEESPAYWEEHDFPALQPSLGIALKIGF